MSSSVVAENSGSQKSENTVIIFVNNDGSIAVDEQTLQKLLVSNQQNAAVSVVRLGATQGTNEATDCQANNEEPANSSSAVETQPEVNLTVEGFFPPSATDVALPADPVVVGTDSLVDPFLEMDREQLERLETALQSEQAKQILGEGVTAMLDMLTSEDDQTTTLKDSIRMDHCYTSSCGKDSPVQAGPSGSNMDGDTEAGAGTDEATDSEDQEDEQETESEEELDSEEEAKRKRNSRGRGRGRGFGARKRGGQMLRTGKARVRGGLKRISVATPPTVKTVPPVTKSPMKTIPPVAKSPVKTVPSAKSTGKAAAARGGLTPQEIQHLQQLQQLKSIPVVKLSSPATTRQPLQAAQIHAMLRGSEPMPTPKPEPVPQPEIPKVVAAEQPTAEAHPEVKIEQPEDMKPKTVDTTVPTEVMPSTPQQESKGKKKFITTAAPPQKPHTRKTSAENVSSPPKEEHKATDVSTEEVPTKKEIAPPKEVTPEAGGTRKMYPKRENRKPPAHLAEAFGPALFSTPDIPRRISDAKAPETKSEVKVEIESKPDDMKMSDAELLALSADLLAGDTSENKETDNKEILAAELQEVLGAIPPELLDEMQDEQLDDLVDEPVKIPVKVEPNISTPKVTASTPKVTASSISTRRRSSAAKTKKEDSLPSAKTPAAAKSKSSSSREGKRAKGLSKTTVAAIRDLQAPSDEDEQQEGDEEDEESWNSEDDPDRLWCICRKPHNNRFMICCDRCEEWFHGVCVGVTKTMGKQMEEKGQEWTCPECAKTKQLEQQIQKAKEIENKRQQNKGAAATAKRKGSVTSSASSETSQTSQQRRKSDDKSKSAATTPSEKSPIKATTAVTEKGVMCIVCKKASARPASVYCSQECILKHAEEATNLINKAVLTTAKVPDGKSATSTVAGTTSTAPSSAQKTPNVQQSRVILLERKTGKILTGNNAPTLAHLNTWLQKHPTYEVVPPTLIRSIRNQKALKNNAVPPKTPPATKQPTLKQGNTLKTVVTTPVTPGTKSPATPTTPKTTLLVPAQKLPTISPKPATQPAAVAAAAAAATKSSPAVKPAVTKAPPASPTKTPKIVVKTPPVSSKVVATKPNVVAPANTAAPVEKVDKHDEEPRIRISVRKTLKDLLHSRVQECDDIKVSDNEVTGIASNIEEELHALFKDTGAKYKAKYRSLLFNIKDPKNLALFRKIVTGEVSPHRLVRLSPEELATKELAQWREREAQHTLDMIKKNEMDLMAQSITYVMKTHKGEQLIETDDSLKLQALAVEAETATLEPATSTVDDDITENSSSSVGKSSGEKLSSSKSSTTGTSSSKHSHHQKEKSSSHRHDKKHSSRRSSRHSSSSTSRSKSHKHSRERSTRDAKHDRDSKEKHHSHSSTHRHSTENHNSKSRHHSEHSETGDNTQEKSSSRSSSSLSKSSGTHRVHHKTSTSSKDPTSTSSTPPLAMEPEPDTKILPAAEERSLQESAVSDATTLPEDADLSDREPSSTVTIKTPDSNAEDSGVPPLWRSSLFGVDITKFSVTAHEVSGNAVGLQQELSGPLEIVGRISPPVAWEYVSKMKKSGTKEIVVVRLNPANPEDKVGYLSYYSYLSNRVRFGVVNIKATTVRDFYIMPLSNHAPIPQVLLPLDGPGFEESRPHLLLGIAVRTRRKRPAEVAGLPTTAAKTKEARQGDTERSYTPPLPEPRESGSYTPPLPPRQTQDDAPYSPGATLDVSSPPSVEIPEKKQNYTSEIEELNRKIEEEKQQIQQRIQNISSELVSSKAKSSSADTSKVTSLLQQITQTQALLGTSVPGLTQLVVQTDVTQEITTQVSSNNQDDENEAYSPSRSFTPPPPSENNKSVTTVPFNLPDTSNISLPSNLQEILASIQRKGAPTTFTSETSTTTGVLSLDSDPIVREYASVDEPAESTTPPPPGVDSPPDMFRRTNVPPKPPKPVVEQKPVVEHSRDPRKPPEPTKKSLSKLTEEELLAMAQAQDIPMPDPVAAPILPPLPPVTPIYYPPPSLPVMAPLMPPGVGPTVLPPLIEQPTHSPPVPGLGEWHATTANKDEVPRKGISFRVEKRAPQPRWCRSTSSDKKNSPKRAGSPVSSPPRQRARRDSSD